MAEIHTLRTFGELHLLNGKEPKFTLGEAVKFQYLKGKNLYCCCGVVIGVVLTPPEAHKVGWWYAIAFYSTDDPDESDDGPWTEYYIPEDDLEPNEGVKVYITGTEEE